MTSVILRKVESIDSRPRQVQEWGERLIACYQLSVEYEFELFKFVWVLAGDSSNPACTEYDDDFDEFLVTISKSDGFSKSRKFVNEVQERFSLAVHFFTLKINQLIQNCHYRFEVEAYNKDRIALRVGRLRRPCFGR